MAFDEVLAERIREAAGDAPLVEKRMFGGLAFLLEGNMAVGVHADDLIVRVAKADWPALLEEPGAKVFDMTGRPMSGWLLVSGDVLDDHVLATWVGRGVAYARSLPPK
ncbi:MAG TPA: TfoX/Sxy family protein [Mycobacteriales bacterium]|jgi:TfoX/Sxy family transcriptional regulator of competence genes